MCVSYSKYALNFEKWMGWFLTERIFVLLLQTSLDLEMPDFCIFLSQDWVKSGKFPSLYIVDEQLTPLILLSGSWSLPGSQGLDSVSSSFWSPVPYCAHSRWGEGESKQGRGEKVQPAVATVLVNTMSFCITSFLTFILPSWSRKADWTGNFPSWDFMRRRRNEKG